MRLCLETTTDDAASSTLLGDLLWDRFFTTCYAQVAFHERTANTPAGGSGDISNEAGGLPAQRWTSATASSSDGSPPRDAISRHHAKLLAFSYFCQDEPVRRVLLAAHLGLIRKLSALVVASASLGGGSLSCPPRPPGMALLLAQCMALAEFMLRTFHGSEHSVSHTARLHSELARAHVVPASAPATTGTNGAAATSKGSGHEHRSRYLSVFETDEEAGVTAWHERPGAARASSRAMCSEISVGGHAGWREAWTGVLKAAAGSCSEDAGYLMLCAWRLLGTLPPEHLVPGRAPLEPGVEGMSRLRSCLVGLQSNGGEWDLFSPSFAAALSTVRDGAPNWFGLKPRDLSETVTRAKFYDPSTKQNPSLARQTAHSGLLEGFAVYARAAIATAAQREGGLIAGATLALASEEGGRDRSLLGDEDRSPQGDGRPGSGVASLVVLSEGMMDVAEVCFRHYQKTIEAALTALYAVTELVEDEDGSAESTGDSPGSPEATSRDGGAGRTADGVRQGEEENDVPVAAPRIPAEMMVPISLLVNCHMMSKSLVRLSSLGFNHHLVGGLHAELNHLSDETFLESLPRWERQACTYSTSRCSQSPGKLSAPYAEPDGAVGAEVGGKGRDAGGKGREAGGSGRLRGKGAHVTRKWEVMISAAAWSTAASCQQFGGGSGGVGGSMPVESDASKPEARDAEDDGNELSGDDVERMENCASKLCLSARSMLKAVLLSVVALTDALVSAEAATRSTKRGEAASDEKMTDKGRKAVGEAWSAIAFRAAALWGEISADPWCRWFVPLCGRAFERLVLQPDPKGGVSLSVTTMEHKREKARAALELWKTVYGSWQVRRADTLINMALQGHGSSRSGGNGDTNDSNLLQQTQVCAGLVLEEGLEQLLFSLAMPSTTRDVLSFYGSGEAVLDANTPCEGAKVAEAIAAVVPSCISVSGAAKEAATAEALGSMEEERVISDTDALMPRGNASSLMAVLERPEFSEFLPNTLLVLRTALEAETQAYNTPSSPSVAAQDDWRRPLASAVVYTLSRRPEAVVQGLVARTLAARLTGVRGNALGQEGALAVLTMAVGYPGVEGMSSAEASGSIVQQQRQRQQAILRKRFLKALLVMAGAWAGRYGGGFPSGSFARKSSHAGSGRTAIYGGKGGGPEEAVDMGSLSLWLASKEGMLPELVVAVMGVARGLARWLETPGAHPDKMQVDDAPRNEGVQQEETTVEWLAGCLELIVTVLRPADGTATDEGDTDSEDDESATDLEWVVGPGKVGARPSVGRSASSAAATVSAAGAAGTRQEPPLVCTFVSSHKQFVNQHWYHCYTCNLVNDQGCCRLCVRLCHRGHDVSYARLSCFFCDCGSSTAESTGEGDTPPPSLENSPASSCGGDGLSGSSPAAGGGTGGTGGASGATGSNQGSSRAKCECLKTRTRRELDALLSPSAPGAKPAVDTVASRAGNARARSGNGRSSSSRRQGSSKKGSRSSSANQAAMLRAKARAAAAATVAAAAVEWRSSPAQTASMRAALFDSATKEGILEDLRAVYSILLEKFNSMQEPRGDIGGNGDGGNGESRGNASIGGHGNGGVVGAAARLAPWDALCGATESATGTPSRKAVFLRCRPMLDPNARVPAYPILAPARLVRNGSLDVRLPEDGARARQDRAAMTLHGVVRRNLASSSCGKIAVAEAQKVLIVDPVGALALRYATAAVASGSTGAGAGVAGLTSAAKRTASSSLSAPADAPVDRSHLCVVSTMAVGFDVIGLAFNPANERHLVAWGLRQCCVVVLNSRGVALRRVQVRDQCVFRITRMQNRPKTRSYYFIQSLSFLV